jgi:tRNA-specific 2-thiouridylase
MDIKPYSKRENAGATWPTRYEDKRMPGRKRIVVAMSGGVDSSVAAALLVEWGYEVIGLMLRLWSEPGEGADNRCCTPESVEDARRVARTLGIPFYLLNCEQRFKARVVDYFVQEYARGHTPNPCLACNQHIKFGYLLDMARTLDTDYLATGHYARVRRENGHCQLLRALDVNKDQSYVLYMLDQERLRRILFPIGGYTKSQVREVAVSWNLPVAEKQDSQDLCFVRDQDYRRFLLTHAPETVRPGRILDTAGRELGQHQGLPFYTIGQRRGLGIAWSEPLYVLDVDAARNALIVGPASQLGRQHLLVSGATFVSGHLPSRSISVTIKIRYTSRKVGATIHPGSDGQLNVYLNAPLRDITPGQAAVFYQGEVLLGGGIIAEERQDYGIRSI